MSALRPSTLFGLCILIMSGCSISPPAESEGVPTITPQSIETLTPSPPADSSAQVSLVNAPLIPEMNEAVMKAHLKDIFAAGAAEGRNANVFTKVGDCMTANEGFLLPFSGNEVELGEFDDLRATIDHFMSVPVKTIEGVGFDSFSAPAESAVCGFNAASVMDPIWSNPDICEANEGPLECELRLSNAAYVLVMLGTHDVYLGEETFRGYLDEVVSTAEAAGVIPLLFTFPTRTDKINESAAFNEVVMEVGAARGVPVINLWRALQSLENYGVVADDSTKLTKPPDGCTVCFTEENMAYGAVVQNLLTLQALDALLAMLDT